jgi:hypothetical protein
VGGEHLVRRLYDELWNEWRLEVANEIFIQRAWIVGDPRELWRALGRLGPQSS